MDCPRRHSAALSQTEGRGVQTAGSQEESGAHASAIAPNNATASSTARVARDFAKDVFELAFADDSGRIVERKRLSCVALARERHKRPPVRVVMVACGRGGESRQHCRRAPNAPTRGGAGRLLIEWPRFADAIRAGATALEKAQCTDSRLPRRRISGSAETKEQRVSHWLAGGQYAKLGRRASCTTSRPCRLPDAESPQPVGIREI
jgi:hypothetical protein